MAEVDWSRWYLDEDDMVESFEQGAIIRTLLSSLEELARPTRLASRPIRRRQLLRLGPRRTPRSCLARRLSDRRPSRPTIPAGWQTWLPGHHPPRWAVEIVSSDWRKDYDDAPPKYAQLGARELVVFDPEVASGAVRNPARASLTLYRRGADAIFVRTYSGDGPVFSNELNVWLHVRHEGPTARLRLCLDQAGTQLVLTAAERAEVEAKHAADEAKHAADEARHAADEAKRADAEARARADAEQRVRELEERLRKLEGPRRS